MRRFRGPKFKKFKWPNWDIAPLPSFHHPKKGAGLFYISRVKHDFWTTKDANVFWKMGKKRKAICLATVPPIVSEVMSTYWLEKRLLISRLNSRCFLRARRKLGKKTPPPATPENWDAASGNSNLKADQSWKYPIRLNQTDTKWQKCHEINATTHTRCRFSWKIVINGIRISLTRKQIKNKIKTRY